MAFSSAQEYFATIQQRFMPERAAGVTGVVQISLGPAGTYHMVFTNGSLTMVPGAYQGQPSILWAMTEEHLLKVVNGQMTPVESLQSGAVHFEGNLALAYRMLFLFHPPTPVPA